MRFRRKPTSNYSNWKILYEIPFLSLCHILRISIHKLKCFIGNVSSCREGKKETWMGLLNLVWKVVPMWFFVPLIIRINIRGRKFVFFLHYLPRQKLKSAKLWNSEKYNKHHRVKKPKTPTVLPHIHKI